MSTLAVRRRRTRDRTVHPLVLAMAAGAGFSVASLYYSQPMLGLIAQDLGAGSAAGLVPT
jgi:hypothetical protein